MQTAAKSNLVLTEFASLKLLAGLPTASGQAEFYQQFTHELIRGVYTKEAFDRLGDRLISIAHHAYTIREMDAVEQAGQMLMNLPLSRGYQSIGSYYRTLCLKRRGQFGESRIVLESLADQVPYQYRARVTMLLAGLTLDSGDFKSALPLYIEAGRAARDRNWCDWFTALTTQRMVAVLKSIDGDHRRALADLENQFTLARATNSLYPHEFYNYLNSLAIELGEVGRLEEAQNVCRIVLASPLISAYPEWRETSDEIQLKAYRSPRSVVSLAQKNTATILQLPEREPAPDVARPWMQSAQVLSLLDWKNKMVKQPNGNDDPGKLPDNISGGDMVMKLLKMMSQDDVTDEQRRKVLEYAIKVLSGQEKR